MVAISIIGIIAALVFFNVATYKGMNITYVSIITTIVMLLTGGVSLSEGVTASVTGVAEIFSVFLVLFILGGMIGVLYAKTGAAMSLCNGFMIFTRNRSLTAKRFNAIIALFVARVLLGLAGMNALAIIPTTIAMAIALFRMTDLPRRFIPCILVVSNTAADTMPGAPSQLNIMIEMYTGVSSTQGFAVRLICSLLLFLGAVFLTYRGCTRDIAKGAHFESRPTDAENLDTSKLPNFFLALVPLILICALYNFANWDAWLALAVGLLVALILLYRYVPVPEGQKRVGALLQDMNVGSMMVSTTMLICVMPGYALTQTSGYQVILDAISAIPIPAAIGFFIIGALMVAIAGNAAIPLCAEIATAIFIPSGLGVIAAAVILLWSQTILDTLPTNLGVIFTCDQAGVSVAEGYRPIFNTTVLLTFFVAIVAVILCMLGLAG